MRTSWWIVRHGTRGSSIYRDKLWRSKAVAKFWCRVANDDAFGPANARVEKITLKLAK